MEFLASLAAYGDVVRVGFGPVPGYVVCDPELVWRVLMDSQTFDKGGLVFDKARALVGDGLVTCARAEHRRQRRLVQPAFHPDRIKAYADVVTAETSHGMAGWRPGEVADISLQMHRLIARITARTLFSTDMAGTAADEVAHHLNTFISGLYRRVLMPVAALERLPAPGNRRYRQAPARLTEVIDALVVDYRRTPGDRGDLLSALLLARDEESGAVLTDQEIRDQVMTMMMAGTETTASALAWTFHYLSTHPDVEQQLHEELAAVLAGREPRVEDVATLDVTRRVLTEVLRLRPAAWILTRVATTATELGGHRLAAGATVVISPYLLQQDPRSFPDPERFDPDRWLPPRAAGVPRGAMIPFGAGSRKCIGDVLALTEATLVVAGVASRWRLRARPGHVVRVVPRMTLGAGPLPMLPTPH